MFIMYVLNVHMRENGGVPEDLMAKVLDNNIVVSLNSSRAITFTFGLISMNPLTLQLWIKLYHCCSSTNIVLSLNNPRRLICN